MIAIADERIEELISEQIAGALPPNILRAQARLILRRRLGVLTIEEAARWLKWKSPVSLSRALKKAGVDLIKTSPRIVTVTLPDLIAFREIHRRARTPLRVTLIRALTKEFGEEAARRAVNATWAQLRRAA